MFSLPFTYSNQKYSRWLKQGGENDSQKCKTAVARFYCQQTFPPCESRDEYAVFPCKSMCEELSSVCRFIPFECPLDGPSVNATEPSRGTHWNSNNDIYSCFDSQSSITPYPFLFFSFLFNSLSFRFLNYPHLPAHPSDLLVKAILITIPSVLTYVSSLPSSSCYL